jgi:threonylcarbamoyladenosine tRNA methylthiotransferase MtaB
VKEIVLTGVNIGDFGNGLQPVINFQESGVGNQQEQNFLNLITALDEVDHIERFRISSIEPNLLTDEIIAFVAKSKKFVPHFHIPLQSGSDKILKLMRRRYLSDLYVNRIEKIKSLMPDCCIGADVIVGFPGETEADFLDTYNFINSLDVSYLHVFTYSERDHTAAQTLKEVIPIDERKRRNKMLRILSQKKLQHFYRQHLGKTATVLFEAPEKDGTMSGFTENYIQVSIPADELLRQKSVPVMLHHLTDDMTVSVNILEYAQ